MSIINKTILASFLTLSIFTTSCATILTTTGLFTERENLENKTEVNKTLIKKENLSPSFDILGRSLSLSLKTRNTYNVEKNQVINYKKNIGLGWNIGAFILDAGFFFLARAILPFMGFYFSNNDSLLPVYGASIGAVDLLFGNLLTNRGQEKNLLSKDSPVEETPFGTADIRLKFGDIVFDGYTNEAGIAIFYYIPPYNYTSLTEGTLIINPKNENPVETTFPLNQSLKVALQEISSGKSTTFKFSSNNSTDMNSPEIKIFEPSLSRGLKITENSDKITIKGKAEDISGISEIKINDADAMFDREGNFSAEIFLKPGENNIEISATDTYKNTARKSFQVTRKESQQTVNLQGWYKKQYAIVVGIDNYKSNSLEKLENAVNDGKSVSNMLKNLGFEVVELYNEKATKKEIISNLSKITKMTENDDSFIFYFAGHGQGISLINKQKIGYIIPQDADISLSESDLIKYDEEAISLNTIKTYSQNMKSKHIALLLDSCFSGLALKRSVPSVINTNIEYYKDLLGRKAINILTAGDDQPVSDGTGHSPFTQALLNGLEKKGIDIQDRDGFATFTELAVYVKEKVEKSTNRRQRPQFDNLIEEDGDFIFKVR